MKFPTLSALLFLVAGSVLAEATWNQWRGPNRNGTVTGTEWPAELKEGSLTPLWKQPLAEGYSGPILSTGAIYTVETKDKKEEIVRALDRKSGEVLWEAKWEGAMKVPFFAAKNGSWVRSTPAYDPESGLLYVVGIRDILVALDAKTGYEKWRVDFMDREGTELPGFGAVSSPLIVGPHLYVQAGCAVTKLDKKTGETVWRALEDRRGMFGSAFSSVVLDTLHGKEQIIAQTRSSLAGLNPDDGKVLWSYDVKAFRGMNILTPLRWENSIFTATYGGGSFLFRVDKFDEGFGAEKAWTAKTEGYMSTPVVYEGHVYMHGRDKRFHCFDLESGEAKWTTEKKFGEYWSLIRNGSKLLALDQKGDLLLIDLDPTEFKLTGQVTVSEKSSTWAHLAVEGDEIYVRDLKGIQAFRWQ